MRVARNNCRLLLLAGALALQSGNASAQPSASTQDPFIPSVSLQGEPKRLLTPEEQEKQEKLDNAYKAATKKIPDQKLKDPWADVRPTSTVPAPKKKQQ